MANWYYQNDGTEHGPVDSRTLKQLAASGQIQASTPLRREDRDNWVKAASVKGLLPEGASRKPSTKSPPEVTAKPVPPELPPTTGGFNWFSWPVVGISLLVCFPVGLYLIWKHPTWQTRTRWVWTGGFVVLAVVGIVAKEVETKHAATLLADADRQWEAGDKGEAGSKYRELIAGDFSLVEASDRQRVVERALLHTYEQNDLGAAKMIQEKAHRFDIDLPFVTEAYYPFKEGTTRHFVGELYLGNTQTQSRKEHRYVSGNRINVRMLNQFVTGGGPSLPVDGPSTLQYRTRAGFIEIGTESEFSNGVAWSPVLKLGAAAGDTWEQRHGNGLLEQFKVVGFEQRNLLKTIEGGGTVNCVIIEKRAVAESVPEVHVVTVFAKGIGPIDEKAWIVEGGKKTLTRSEGIMPVLREE